MRSEMVAVVGRPNVGKSSLMKALPGRERARAPASMIIRDFAAHA